MGYDSKYRTGLSWLNDAEDESCSSKIKTAMYAAIYDEHGDQDVVVSLMDAYERQRGIEMEARGSEKELLYLSGDEAHVFMYETWKREFMSTLRRLDVPCDYEGVERSEIFEWPSTLPYKRPILRAVLQSVGKRMGAADAATCRALRDYAKQEQESTE